MAKFFQPAALIAGGLMFAVAVGIFVKSRRLALQMDATQTAGA